MADGLRIEWIDDRTVVSLTVTRASADDARQRLSLAAPLESFGGAPASLWLAPGTWLLVDDRAGAEEIVARCNEALQGQLFHAIDVSAAYSIVRLWGQSVRELLAAGCGIDVRPGKFAPGMCCRTRLAQVAAVLVAGESNDIDCYVDRSYVAYLDAWLRDTAGLTDLQ